MKSIKILFSLIITSLLFVPQISQAQTGISVSPPRTYFTLDPGQTETKTILVSNPSQTNTLELSVSFNDWQYDQYGNNVVSDAGTLATSNVAWINVLPQSFFSLAPGASHELQVQMQVPENADTNVPVHTSMLYITQINPSDGVNEQGANIKIAVRSGVKIYHRFASNRQPNVEVSNFAYSKTENPETIKFSFQNDGNVWADGTISCDLLNQETGDKVKLEDVVFYSMPGDKRDVFLQLPETLKPGKYIATALIDYEDASAVKLAELSFTYEK
jgi:P pilus assembly chaperone PapD